MDAETADLCLSHRKWQADSFGDPQPRPNVEIAYPGDLRGLMNELGAAHAQQQPQGLSQGVTNQALPAQPTQLACHRSADQRKLLEYRHFHLRRPIWYSHGLLTVSHHGRI